jgi:hypothetical protein
MEIFMSSKTSSLAIWFVLLLLVGAGLACTADINVAGKNISIGDAPAEAEPAPPPQKPPQNQPPPGNEPPQMPPQQPPQGEQPPAGGPALGSPPQGEQQPPPAQGGEPQPAQAEAEPPPPPPAGQLETLQLPSLDPAGDGLANLGTFRQKMAVQFNADQAGYSTNMNYSAEVNTGQSAIRIAVAADGAAASNLPSSQMEAIWIGDKVWVKLGNQPWLPVPQSMAEAPFGEQPVSAGAFLPYAPQAQRIEPDETVNGVLSRHYRYNVENLSTEAGTITGSGDIYTAVDGGYVVRYTLNGRGNFQQGLSGSGAINLIYDTYDVGAAISIDSPRW